MNLPAAYNDEQKPLDEDDEPNLPDDNEDELNLPDEDEPNLPDDNEDELHWPMEWETLLEPEEQLALVPNFSFNFQFLF